MSAVMVADGKGGFAVDYTDQQEKVFAKFESEGLHVVESTTPIAEWPGIGPRLAT